MRIYLRGGIGCKPSAEVPVGSRVKDVLTQKGVPPIEGRSVALERDGKIIRVNPDSLHGLNPNGGPALQDRDIIRMGPGRGR